MQVLDTTDPALSSGDKLQETQLVWHTLLRIAFPLRPVPGRKESRCEIHRSQVDGSADVDKDKLSHLPCWVERPCPVRLSKIH